MAYNPLQFVLAVQSLRPGVEPLVDFQAADHGDGKGPSIARWLRTDLVEPTQAQIEAVDTDALLAAAKAVLPQDMMAQFNPADMVKISAAIAADATGATALLWYSMVAQRDPMLVSNSRFKAGWTALAAALGADRMTAIAAALEITVGA